jgi:ComF family protein
MGSLLANVSRFAADLLFPPQCALCGGGGVLLCEPCADALPRAEGERCHRCWAPVRDASICGYCAVQQPVVSSLRAAFVMDGGARRLAHELKYEGLVALAEPMARLIVEAFAWNAVDFVAPVPLHRSRERSRGYNQAGELARRLGRFIGRPYEGRALRRIRNTEPLAKTMHREERWAIVEGAFKADRHRVENQRVLLIDDVATTGATLDAAARALLDAGAADVRCVTWARAD